VCLPTRDEKGVVGVWWEFKSTTAGEGSTRRSSGATSPFVTPLENSVKDPSPLLLFEAGARHHFGLFEVMADWKDSEEHIRCDLPEGVVPNLFNLTKNEGPVLIVWASSKTYPHGEFLALQPKNLVHEIPMGPEAARAQRVLRDL
jgi:hypothetical protein